MFCRYKVLLPPRSLEASDRAQTAALLEMVGAEEGQFQLGLTKVLSLLILVAEEKLTPSPSAHVANTPVPVSGVSQGGSLSAAGGQVEQHADVGRRHHPEEHSRLPLQEELQVLQTESHHHPKSHSGTPGQVQS